MRICICDDDNLIVEQLSDYIHSFFERYHILNFEIALFQDGESLLKDNKKKDIVFLDVVMPDMNGIYVGQTLKKINKNTIIFIVTTYIEYLDEAMKFHVFRYLSKPIDKQRLYRNLKDAIQCYHNVTTSLLIETKDNAHTLLTNDIILVEAVDRKVIIRTLNHEYESIHNMEYWIQTLPSGSFFQSHRSFIINFSYVTDFNHNIIWLNNNQFKAYLTRRKYAAFKNNYLLYLESMR